MELRDLQAAKALAERQCAQAQAELAAARRSLRDVRRRFADQYLENRQLQDRLAALAWVAADLLQAGDRADNLPAEAMLLRQMESRRRQQRELLASLTEMAGVLRENNSASEPVGVMRRELLERLGRVIDLTRELAHQPPAVAGRGGGDSPHDVHVLTINDELQAVIVNRGRTDGIAVASEWTPADASATALVLEIVEAGDQFSVAVPLSGSLRAIGPGSRLTMQTNAAGVARPQ